MSAWKNLRISCFSHETHNFAIKDLKRTDKNFNELNQKNQKIYHHPRTRKQLLTWITIPHIVEDMEEIDGADLRLYQEADKW